MTRAYAQLPDWILAEALTSPRVEIMVHVIAMLLFIAESFAVPFIAAWRFVSFACHVLAAYHVLAPFRRMQQFLDEDHNTLGFELQSGWSAILAGLYSQFGAEYLRYTIRFTYGPDWAWSLAGIVIGIAQIVAVSHGTENRAVAMVFGLAYWCALATVIILSAGLVYLHALLAPACVAYLLCIFSLRRRANGAA